MCDSEDIDTMRFNINPELSIGEKERLHALLKKRINCLASHPLDLGTTDIAETWAYQQFQIIRLVYRHFGYQFR